MVARKIFFILIGAFISLTAMDKPLPPKSTDIELISSDNKTFTLPLEIAQQSPMLSVMLSQFGGKKTKTIKLTLINNITLKLIIKVMELFYKYGELKGKVLLDKVATEYQRITRLMIPINNRQTLALLRAFDFLEFTPGIQLIARKISTNQFMIEQVMKLVHTKQLSTNTATEIGRMYYLITNKYLSDIDANDFRFSLRDYLDYKPELIKERSWHSVQLNLEELQLKDLDGLQDIPYLSNINFLDLTKNNLTKIPDLGAMQLNNLEYLFISHNPLSYLSASCFNGLKNLTELNLGFNNLLQLPATIFQGLTKLKNLFLYYNHLSELPETLFKDLVNLKKLQLNSNQLTHLPPHIFDNLTNLQELDLSHNELSILPSVLFNNLINLRAVNFFYNKPLNKVPVQLFEKLNRLQEVDLRVNEVSEENIEKLRKAYPNVRIQF